MKQTYEFITILYVLMTTGSFQHTKHNTQNKVYIKICIQLMLHSKYFLSEYADFYEN